MASKRYFEGEDPISRLLPSVKHFQPTFTDDEDLKWHTHRIILNTDGTLHYESTRGDEITYAFNAGAYEIGIKKIYDTGTTYTENNVLCLV